MQSEVQQRHGRRMAPPLREVRRAQGLGLREVARRANIDPGHLSRVERGKESLSLEALARLAGVLKLHDLARLLAPYVATADDVPPIDDELARFYFDDAALDDEDAG
jgi:transcriptional regulator with XRE-family HTH domain